MKFKVGDRVTVRADGSKGKILNIDSLQRALIGFDSGAGPQWIFIYALKRLVKKKKPASTEKSITVTKKQLADAWDKHIARRFGPFDESDISLDFGEICKELGFNE